MTPDATHDNTSQNGTMTSDTTHDSDQVHLVTISAAAALLEQSVRTVQRGLDSGRWQSDTLAGKRVVKLRPSDLPPGKSFDESAILESDALNVSPVLSRDTTQSSSALALPNSDSRAVALIAAVVRETLNQSEERNGAPAAQEIAAKLMLSPDEAAVYSGLSRGAIEQAIRDGQLQAHRGKWRGRRLKRADLEAWVSSL